MPDSTDAEKLAGRSVAVIGGATAGAELAARLAAQGATVAVFEQNLRPYGKIEDGLPRWHVALRRKEYRTIDEKLSRDGVHFVPGTRIGRDLEFSALCNDWDFQTVVLANGAWRDRPLPVAGADDYVGKGLVYQNPFIIWFNHAHEADYDGEHFDTPDDSIIVGGGLASIDVAKALMLETVRAKLLERGIEEPMLELEVKGIPKVLERHGLAFEDLGLEGCTIFYRRRAEDMPLVDLPEDATPERADKVRGSRRKLLEKAMQKYCFKLVPLSAPDGLIAENGRLVGLRFRRTRIEDGRVVPTDETYERRGSQVVSSIGSIPEQISGIEMKGELFAFTDWDLGRLAEYPNVFSAGNVVTGKGNILASRKHATHVAEEVIAAFLGVGETEGHAGEETLVRNLDGVVDGVEAHLSAQPPLTPDALEQLVERVRGRQRAVGYDGEYRAWIERVSPRELE